MTTRQVFNPSTEQNVEDNLDKIIKYFLGWGILQNRMPKDHNLIGNKEKVLVSLDAQNA